MTTPRITIAPHGGATAIHVDGHPITGVMHWNRHLTRDDARAFADAGVTCFSFIGNIDLGDGGRTFEGNAFQPMTTDFLDASMEAIVSACPNALVIPRLRLIPTTLWLDAHPDETLVMHSIRAGQLTRIPTATPASRLWAQTALERLQSLVEHAERTWPDHILGYHSGFGNCAEHVWFWNHYAGDYTPAMQLAFRDFLRTRYRSDDELRHAWNDPDASLDRATTPPPHAFVGFSPDSLLHPLRDRAVIDFYQCQCHLMASLVTEQAHAVKDTLRRLGRQKLFGAFYAYVSLPANSQSHFAVAHDEHQTVLDCPDLDYLAAPIAYQARQPGGVCHGQVMPGSILCHHKLYYAEDDTGTHLSATRHNVMPASLEQTDNLLRRNFLDAWRSGGTQWFMDLFGEGSFRSPDLMETIRQLTRFAQRHLDDRQSIAQVAVLISDRSLSVSRTLDVLSGSMLELQLQEVAAIGAPFDAFRLEDLPQLVSQGRLGQYRLVLLPNAHLIADDLRELIDRHLKADGRTLVWVHAPDVWHQDGLSTEHVCRMTGIRLVPCACTSSMLTETLVTGQRLLYGPHRSVSPRLYGADPDAETLGYGVDATAVPLRQGSDGATLLRKTFPTWTSVWSASPTLPAALLQHFAQNAGVHLCSRRGDHVSAAPNWLAVHAKWDGPLTLHLTPEQAASAWHDAFTDAPVPVAASDHTVTLNLTRGQTVALERKNHTP